MQKLKMQNSKKKFSEQIAYYTFRTLLWGQKNVPKGLRVPLGLLLMLAGIFGFLPVLGFWMFPLGAAFVALDIPFARKHVELWMKKLANKSKK
tara:strand:+ start:304 stop:582 length:279 start_codon:yes stop_codon:yes gene_type:complete